MPVRVPGVGARGRARDALGPQWVNPSAVIMFHKAVVPASTAKPWPHSHKNLPVRFARAFALNVHTLARATFFHAAAFAPAVTYYPACNQNGAWNQVFLANSPAPGTWLQKNWLKVETHLLGSLAPQSPVCCARLHHLSIILSQLLRACSPMQACGRAYSLTERPAACAWPR